MHTTKREKIRLVVFDWAGTTVDYGSLAPADMFDRVFRTAGITLTREEINRPMGMEKKDHIRELLSSESGDRQFRQVNGRAIMQNPKLLLCDEPIASLDPSSAKTIMELLRSMTQKRGIACIVNLHQLDAALTYSDRIIGLSRGEIVFNGRPDDLTDDCIEQIYGTSRKNLMMGGQEHDTQNAIDCA
jgi:phosphonate transport system ATP-binding protein